MKLVTVSEPQFFPVSLAEVWEHMRITPEGSPAESPLDALLLRNVATATKTVESFLHRSLVQRTLRLGVPSFPDTGNGIRLVHPPVLSSSVSVRYYDSSNTLVALDPSAWFLVEGECPEVFFVTTPGTPYSRPDAVQVTYQAGYAPSSGSPATQAIYSENIPKQYKDAVLMVVEMLSGNTSPEDKTALWNAVKMLCGPTKIHVLA